MELREQVGSAEDQAGASPLQALRLHDQDTHLDELIHAVVMPFRSSSQILAISPS